MLPEFDIEGDLPPGIHGADLDEFEQRFSRFAVSDRRINLFTMFQQLVAIARSSGIVDRLVIGGSFVTSKPEPNDLDVMIVISQMLTLIRLLQANTMSLIEMPGDGS